MFSKIKNLFKRKKQTHTAVESIQQLYRGERRMPTTLVNGRTLSESTTTNDTPRIGGLTTTTDGQLTPRQGYTLTTTAVDADLVAEIPVAVPAYPPLTTTAIAADYVDEVRFRVPEEWYSSTYQYEKSYAPPPKEASDYKLKAEIDNLKAEIAELKALVQCLEEHVEIKESYV